MKRLALFLLLACGLNAQTITATFTSKNQQVDGFGAATAFQQPSGASYLSTNAAQFFGTTGSDLGLSILRVMLVPTYTDCNANVGPNGFMINSGYTCLNVTGGTITSPELSMAQTASGYGLKIFATPWSPPAALKSNGSAQNGGSLISGDYTTWAGYIADFVGTMAAQTPPVSIYAVSIQNEPDVNQTYPSAIWTGAQLATFVPDLASALSTAGYSSVKIMMPEEDSASSTGFSFDLATSAMSSGTTAAQIGILASHGYGTPPNSGGTITKPSFSNFTTQHVWMTEDSTSDAYDGSITNALLWATSIHGFMSTAQVNAYIYWGITSVGLGTDNEGLTDQSGNIAKRAYVLGMYSRACRPTDYMTAVTNSTGLLVDACVSSDGTSRASLLVTNDSGSAATNQVFQISGFAANAVIPYITSSTQNIAAQTPVAVTAGQFTYTVPADSVVWFQATSPQVYIRTPGTNFCNVLGATDATPIQITVDSASACGLTNGATITVVDVEGNTAANSNPSNPNQMCREVSGLSSNTFNLLDCSGANTVGNGSYVTSPAGAGNGRIGLATAYTLKSPPIVWLDGPTGTLYQSLSNTSDKAQTGNPAYQALVNKVPPYLSSYANQWGADAIQVPLSFSENSALYWTANGNTSALTAALWGITNIDQYDTPACDETNTNCGDYGQNEGNYSAWYGPPVAQLFSLVHSQLSSTQITAFCDYFMNDLPYTSGGIDTSTHTKLAWTTPSGTFSMTQFSTAVVGSGTAFSTSAPAGSVIMLPNQGFPIFLLVASVTDNTHLTISYPWQNNSCSNCPASYPGTNANWYVSLRWSTANYGVIWFEKHGQTSPLCGGSLCATSYPTQGGVDLSYPNYPPNAVGNLQVTSLAFWIQLGLATCADDVRGCLLAQEAYEYWYDLGWGYNLSTWTGANQSGATYNHDRTYWMNEEIALTLQNSLVSGPNIITSNVFAHIPAIYYSTDRPNTQSGNGNGTVMTFGEVGSDQYWDVLHMESFPIDLYMNSGSTQGTGANYWFQNYSGFYSASAIQQGNGGWIPLWYVFFDPAFSAVSPPTATALWNTDLSNCESIFGTTARTIDSYTNQYSCQFSSPTNPTYSLWTSKTGFTAADRKLYVNSMSNASGTDHSDTNIGNTFGLHTNYTLMGNDDQTSEMGTGLIAIGGTGNQITTGPWAYVGIKRFTDGTAESATGKYAYGLVDSTGAYVSGVSATRVQRHFAHLKKSGTQDYVVEYTDLAAASNTLESFYDLTLDGCGASTSSSCITASLSSGTFANLQPSQAVLNSKVLPVAGSNSIFVSNQNASNTNGSYTGGNGYTWRYFVCASSSGSSCNSSATTGEWLAVYQQSATTTTTMPTLTQPTVTATGGSATAVQIADTNPKVAIFARQGATLTAASLTTTHSGTAQYLVAGMAPGTYAVTVGGTPVSCSPCTVAAGDNTIYWESGSGNVSIGAPSGVGGSLIQGSRIAGSYIQ